MELQVLFSGVPYTGTLPQGEALLVTQDSRRACPGAVFVCARGMTTDGHDHARKALEAGAVCIVTERPLGLPGEVQVASGRKAYAQLCQNFFGRPAEKLRLVAVTGTNGKTTVTTLIKQTLEQAGCKAGLIGTIHTEIDAMDVPAKYTTPEPWDLNALFSRMVLAGCTFAVMEASSQALDQLRLWGLTFEVGVFTNLTQDHLDYHKSMESYFQVKARLFLELPRPDKAMAVNADDPWGRRLLELCPTALSFGLQKGALNKRHLWGELLSAGTEGCHMRMHLEGSKWELRSPLVGAFNASNLLAVQAVALEMGIEPDAFKSLESFTGVSGRLERVENPQGLNVFVDYAHTPDALENVLQALRGAGFKRVVTVFGCGGNRDRTKRPLMGEAVARWSDVAVLTSDNPRFEEPEAILQDVLPGLKSAREVVVEVDRRAATIKALKMLGKDDALLIAGKGHEDYQIIQGVKHHYSDQEVVREFLHCD
ncbi:UDP-N-acetylmuramoyl-L-alanyl-D-glutamate--2,6-diaminopimelate ligase [uncultured Desulfovibrio sp.]|uniref:UDP-N-acetylmuramoyl-L-alanyl-D-glutamate--2, 6-diaminopimelate ligase n=1 Tax=uncultured Desulfovibrio sp. TaxID=167968 RepID=UPI0026293160|nr:UDP-N-acetylmuramoyl-L-alanyl-D-glutamate--2,6-diaminopimelate ligase [uncultured Desulfovibrio sp.]